MGRRRVAELPRQARPLLVDLTGSVGDTGGDRADRIDIITATAADAPAAALLIRPDGYVAWAATNPEHDGLATASTRWFGSASTPAPVIG
ncbi:hypothetical protein IU459_11365 [Nocardia amamiensis]|uniref:Uncharacterized protein n=1 Tax=Nocardia amamiensis TaxID=404578 RepID=A0ABS0CNL1_9NOCA|nr:hypothetical protein [Nocardia amamiensis]MBF6298140.1 hypothetical protein [Nocardia amamiensis]